MEGLSNKNLKGIDVSNWQRDIDFKKVKSQGFQVVYIKATEGDYFRDSYAKQNYERAKKEGLKVGFYHFFKPNKGAKKQAKFFVDYLNSIGATDYEGRLALDIEVSEGKSPYELTNLCIEFLEEVKKLTKREVVVYTYTSFANNNLDKRLGVYPLWIAEYGVKAPKNNKIWDSWIGFQYSSSGKVLGISGFCDLNELKEDILDVKVNLKVQYATTKNVSTYLNIREKENLNSKIIGKIPSKEEFILKSKDNLGWYLIQYKNIVGYVKVDYVKRIQRAVANNIEGILKVYEKGSRESKVIDFLKEGEIFIIDWVDSNYLGWYRISTKRGKSGFVESKFVKKI